MGAPLTRACDKNSTRHRASTHQLGLLPVYELQESPAGGLREELLRRGAVAARRLHREVPERAQWGGGEGAAPHASRPEIESRALMMPRDEPTRTVARAGCGDAARTGRASSRAARSTGIPLHGLRLPTQRRRNRETRSAASAPARCRHAQWSPPSTGALASAHQTELVNCSSGFARRLGWSSPAWTGGRSNNSFSFQFSHCNNKTAGLTLVVGRQSDGVGRPSFDIRVGVGTGSMPPFVRGLGADGSLDIRRAQLRWTGER